MPGAGAPGQDLADGHGRRIRYLRLSLTDRCNFSCSYCSPHPQRGGESLSRAELTRLVRVFAGLGIERVRLTGGEPTLRADLLEVVGDIAAVPGIAEIALTTNGHLLAELAGPLRAAGVARVNVSLDTLDPRKLAQLSGRAASLPRILSAFDAARRAAFASLKLNAVVVRGVNDGELGDLARFAWRHGAIARFIELMPFAGGGEPVPTAQVKQLLERQGLRLEPDASRGWGPAYHMRGTSDSGGEHLSGLVGFIGAMTERFCADCNRVRVGADGSLRACLGGRDRVELATLLRSETSDAELGERIRAALLLRPAHHEMATGERELLPMIGVGG